MDGNNSLVENMKMEKKPEEAHDAVREELQILKLRLLDYKIFALKRIREKDYLNIGDLFLTKKEKEEKQYIQNKINRFLKPFLELDVKSQKIILMKVLKDLNENVGNNAVQKKASVYSKSRGKKNVEEFPAKPDKKMDGNNSLNEDMKMEKKPDEAHEAVGKKFHQNLNLKPDERMSSAEKTATKESAAKSDHVIKIHGNNSLTEDMKMKKKPEEAHDAVGKEFHQNLDLKPDEHMSSAEKTVTKESAAKSDLVIKMDNNNSVTEDMKMENEPEEGREAVGNEFRQILDLKPDDCMISAEKTVVKEFFVQANQAKKMDGNNSLNEDMKMEKKPEEAHDAVGKEFHQNLSLKSDERMSSAEKTATKESAAKSDHVIKMDDNNSLIEDMKMEKKPDEGSEAVGKEFNQNLDLKPDYCMISAEKTVTKEFVVQADHTKKMEKELNFLDINFMEAYVLMKMTCNPAIKKENGNAAKNDKMESIMSQKELETFEWKSNTEEKHLTKQKESLAEHEKMLKKKMRKNKEKMIKENQWLTIGELGHMTAVHQIVVDRLKIACCHIWNLRLYVPYLMI